MDEKARALSINILSYCKTKGRRVLANTLATYGRSVVSALLGLFTARWVLEVLGSSDFGLYGVIGGIVFVFSFLTPVFSLAIGRFYAFSLERPEQVRQLFNVSLVITSVLAVLLVVLVYPIGLYALDHWLAVPDGRQDAAVWVLRFALVTAFSWMISIPYSAMFTARQDIVEASFYQLAQTVLIFGWVGYMKFFWADMAVDSLVAYSAVMAGIVVGLVSVQIFRAYWKYPECSIAQFGAVGWRQVAPLLKFAGWQVLGGLAWMVRFQGLAFFVNVLFGAAFNASYTISNQVSSQASALSNSMTNAVAPVVTSAEGSGRRKEMLDLAWLSSLIGGGLVLVFAVPLVVFINPILRLWLGNPPPGCAELCVAMMVVAVLRQFSAGHGMAILAHGKLGPWQVCDALTIVLALPIAYGFWKAGLGIASVGWAYVISEALGALNRILFARRLREKGG